MVAMRAICSSVSPKSNTSMFCAIRSARTDLGITTTPRWMSQRSTTWGDGLAVGGADLGQGRVGEQVVAALGERSPGLVLDAALAHERLVGGALEEGVGLDLVDGGVTSCAR
jgi:hypothetical protein